MTNLTRRSILTGLAATLAAPSLVKAASLDYVPRQAYPWQHIGGGTYKLLEKDLQRRIYFPRGMKRFILEGVRISGRGQILPRDEPPRHDAVVQIPVRASPSLISDVTINFLSSDRRVCFYAPPNALAPTGFWRAVA